MGKRTCHLRDVCSYPIVALGLCSSHYQRYRRCGDPLWHEPDRKVGRPVRSTPKPPCALRPDCEGFEKALGLCEPHYMRYVRHGDPLWAGQRDPLNKGKPLRTPAKVLMPTAERVDGEQRYCTTCARWLPLEEFHASSSSNAVAGRSWRCRGCSLAYHRLRRFGVTTERFEEMLAEQDGVCAICARPPGAKAMHIDHDHQCCPTNGVTCGKCVRGLLCAGCNLAIGQMRDDISVVERALVYLKLHRRAPLA